MKDIQRQEAIERLNYLTKKGLLPDVLDSFKNGELYYSDKGVLYYFNEENGVDSDWIKKVKDFEEKYDCVVYHISHEFTAFGELLDLFYISNSDEEWQYDRQDLENNVAFSYVYNLSIPEFSEFGTIGFNTYTGGITRTA